jgi:hypothetical protein
VTTYARVDASTHPPASSGFRMPTNPSLILIERRPVAMVDAYRRPRPLESLSPREVDLFAAQLAMFRAAVALICEEDAFREVGQYGDLHECKRHLETIKARKLAWDIARDEWEFLRGQ